VVTCWHSPFLLLFDERVAKHNENKVYHNSYPPEYPAEPGTTYELAEDEGTSRDIRKVEDLFAKDDALTLS